MKQEPPHLAHLTKGWCRSQFCLFQAAMLESEYCSVSTLLPQTKAGFSVEGRKMETGSFYSTHFFLYVTVLIVLDGERRRLRVWGLREQEEDGAVRVTGWLSLCTGEAVRVTGWLSLCTGEAG